MCFRYCINKATHGHETEYNKYVLTAKAEDILMDGNPCEGETGSAFVTQRVLRDHTEKKYKYVQLGRVCVHDFCEFFTQSSFYLYLVS